MTIEIERKFLLSGDGWREIAGAKQHIRQAYLASSSTNSVRIRIADNSRGRLTVKSPFVGITRNEYEYDIPVEDAIAMLNLRQSGIIEKARYHVPLHDMLWEIDVFCAENAGLQIAEIELKHHDQKLILPDWIGREVTADPRYQNSALAVRPFASWT